MPSIIDYNVDSANLVNRLNSQLNVDSGRGVQAPKGSGGGTAAGKAKDEADLNFDTFIKLMTTQLQHQDPLNPMDGTAFTEQIATFSQLEQSIATNAHLERLLESYEEVQEFSTQALAVSFIGKETLAPGNRFTHAGEEEQPIFYNLDEQAASVTVEVIKDDGSGEVVKTLDGEVRAGLNTLQWDAEDEFGKPIENGKYIASITAYDAGGSKIRVTPYNFGKVHAVNADGSDASLVMEDGRKMRMSDLIYVREASQEQQTN